MRIAIIGWPGTGKTTLGKGLAEQFGVPYRLAANACN
jgi:adenylate kinase family enzyme